MTIWKHGVHWGRGDAPNHYNFIKREGIVIGLLPTMAYEIDDLVIITDGFTVKAIARVAEAPRPITDEPRYAHVHQDYEILYIPQTTFAKAEWYDYPFWYELMMAGNQVHDPERIRVMQNIWDNR